MVTIMCNTDRKERSQILWSSAISYSFIDLNEGFDTINHETLLVKLEDYRSRGIINSWFWSYLTDRKQTTQENNAVSEAETTLCGVPQGSHVRPLLFRTLHQWYLQVFALCLLSVCKDISKIIASNNLAKLESLELWACQR